MNNSILLGYAVSILPKLTLVFVVLLLLYKVFFKIRSRYNVTVNCWFCNENSKVPYLESNSWTCKKCEQYNGFNKDGGYNREIRQQFDCSANSTCGSASENMSQANWINEQNQNGFCDACNEAQRLKVEKLSQFNPKKESRFDQELKVYKAQLEEQYRLCATCDRHLKTVLRTKKKMVLGSKFLEYIVKGAEALNQPQFSLMRQVKQELWKRRLAVLTTFMTAINLFCIFGSLPSIDRTWFTDTFGESFGLQLFIICSHVAALWRVLTSYITTLNNSETVVRLTLFARTIFMMLLYSLGLKLPQLVRLNFSSLYMLISPFCILATTFSYNVIDRFKLTRFTLLLVLWSICAGGIVDHNLYTIQQSIMFITSLVTCLLAVTTKAKSSPKLYDKNATSFHKIFSDDYASDGETIESSGFSRQFDCSSISARSDNTNRSFSTLRTYQNKSPITSSTFSLHKTPNRNPFLRNHLQMYDKNSPMTSSTFSLHQATNHLNHLPQEHPLNTSFKSSYADSNSTLRSRHNNSVYNVAASARNSFIQPPQQSPFVNNNPNGENSIRNNFFTEFPLPCESRQNGNITLTSPSLHSPFSHSNFVVNNSDHPPSRVLSPSRFAFNSFTTGFSSTNDNFTQPLQYQQPYKQFTNIDSNQYSNYLLERRDGLAAGNSNDINEDLSRASSRSSGFESQNEHLNNSRENSCCPEDSNLNDLSKRNLLLDKSRSFQPLEINRLMFSPLSNGYAPSLNSTNCSSEWHNSVRSQPMSRDTFNLRGINQGLPNIKRGDLLRKWKEGEVMN